MRLAYLVLSFTALIILDYYLKTNIGAIGEGGVNILFLGLFIALSGGIVLWRASARNVIAIQYSTLLLISFLVYYIFRIGIDLGSIDRLKAYTIGTSGGVMLFYIIGSLAAGVMGGHVRNAIRFKQYLTYLSIFSFAYILLSFGLLLSLLLEFGARLRIDILLIESEDGDYQRPGNFLVIGYLLVAAVYAQFISLRGNANTSFWIKILSPALFVLFIIYAFTSMLMAQMIGSNNATVLIAVLCLGHVAIMLSLRSKSFRTYLSVKKITLIRLLFGNIARRLMLSGVLSLIILVVIFITAVGYLGIDLSMTRLGGYGSGEISSIGSRIALLDNFVIQFSYSPIWGNMNVDCSTTGCGTFVHSVFLQLITHTGIFGLLLFVLYWVLACREILRHHPKWNGDVHYFTNVSAAYSVINISFILILGVLATAFTWATLWFSMGLYFAAIKSKI